jgi:hypothetical protein
MKHSGMYVATTKVVRGGGASHERGSGRARDDELQGLDKDA